MPPHEIPTNMLSTVTIRSYVATDYETVRELFIDGMIGTYCPDDTNQGLRNYVTRSLVQDMADIEGTYFDSGGHFWVATMTDASGNETIIGSIALEGKKDTRGEIRRLSVRRGYRRLGLGRQLMAHLEKWAQTQRFESVFLTTGSEMGPAMQLYETLGYSIFQRVPAMNNPNKILISYEKKLN